MKTRKGFSLVELLVVVAIISILMALYMGTLHKAMGKARRVAKEQGHRQEYLGRMADNANIARDSGAQWSTPSGGPGRADCRAAYRQKLEDTGSFATELLYVVKSEEEFRAYWNTVVNPEATDPLTIEGGVLVAQDPEGNTYLLPVIRDFHEAAARYGVFPVAWEFLSTDMGNTTLDGIGTSVLYSDGHIAYKRYPTGYPACKSVAEMSQRFVDLS